VEVISYRKPAKTGQFNFYSREFFMFNFNRITKAGAVIAIDASAATAFFAREPSERPRGGDKGHDY
jgi:hypothetical protein